MEIVGDYFRSTDRDDLIVDVHEKTTTIEVRILCTSRLNPWATQLAATVSAARLVPNFRYGARTN